jgi:predicted DNA-binding transcriptional regulator YafY
MSASALSRQWVILKSLPSRAPGITSRELLQLLAEQGFCLSKRTIERDLQELSAIFPVCSNEKSKPYGWYWAADSSIEVPGIMLTDALTILLIENSLKTLLPAGMLKGLQPRFAQARNKLRSLSDDIPLATWLDKVAAVSPEMSLLPPAIDEMILQTLQQALLNNKQVIVRYGAVHQKQVKDFYLSPLGLVQRGQTTYVVATAGDYQDVRLFALHRFQLAELTDIAVNIPPGFTLASYIASGAFQFCNGETVQLHARVSQVLADILDETPLSEDMTMQPATDGWFEIKATVINSWQLKWWILSRGGAIEILAPISLRQMIATHLSNALAHYQN